MLAVTLLQTDGIILAVALLKPARDNLSSDPDPNSWDVSSNPAPNRWNNLSSDPDTNSWG
jgi:hypothetical protein